MVGEPFVERCKLAPCHHQRVLKFVPRLNLVAVFT